MAIQLVGFFRKNKPTQERLLELENYANYIGLICEVEWKFIRGYQNGTLIKQEVKDYISRLMLAELKHINNYELDLLYNAWIESIHTYVTDIKLIKK